MSAGYKLIDLQFYCKTNPPSSNSNNNKILHGNYLLEVSHTKKIEMKLVFTFLRLYSNVINEETIHNIHTFFNISSLVFIEGRNVIERGGISVDYKEKNYTSYFKIIR